jgi:hypothetical protein
MIACCVCGIYRFSSMPPSLYPVLETLRLWMYDLTQTPIVSSDHLPEVFFFFFELN